LIVGAPTQSSVNTYPLLNIKICGCEYISVCMRPQKKTVPTWGGAYIGLMKCNVSFGKELYSLD